MAVKLGSLLATQFKKLGIDPNTDELKALVAIETEVADDIANKLDGGLLTVTAAQTNPDVLKVLRKNILNPADELMVAAIKEHGITVDDAFATNTNTYEKLPMLIKAALHTGKVKGEGTGKGDVAAALKTEREEAAKEKEKLATQIQQLTTSLEAKETEFKTARKTDATETALYKKLLGKSYAFPDEMDVDLKVNTAQGAITTQLKKMGLQFQVNDAGQLTVTDANGQAAYDEKMVAINNVDHFIDGVLTHNKILKINDVNPQNLPKPGAAGQHFVPGGANTQNASIVAELEQQLAAMG